jgi:sRNA-binding protein
MSNWTCPYCETENAENIPDCEGCGEFGPQEAAKAQAEKDEAWSALKAKKIKAKEAKKAAKKEVKPPVAITKGYHTNKRTETPLRLPPSVGKKEEANENRVEVKTQRNPQERSGTRSALPKLSLQALYLS